MAILAYNTSLETDKWRSWQITDELTEQHLSDSWLICFHWCPFRYMLRRAACKFSQLPYDKMHDAITYRTNTELYATYRRSHYVI